MCYDNHAYRDDLYKELDIDDDEPDVDRADDGFEAVNPS